MIRVSKSIAGRAGAAALAVGLALAPTAPTPARAEVFSSVPVRHRTIFVPVDKSLPFHLDGRASKIVIAQPDLAAIFPTGVDSFYIQGKDLGETNLLVYGPGGNLAEVVDVRVGYDASALQEDLQSILPNENIGVRPTGVGLLLYGNVSNGGVAARAKAIAEKYAPNAVTSNLTYQDSTQVILEVRVVEASRSMLQDIGMTMQVGNHSYQFVTQTGLLGSDAAKGILSLMGMSGTTTIDNQLSALESKGLVRTLARPNLVALSGEKASFLAGGEFPYPVPQGTGSGTNAITIEFRKYGVKLDFVPVVEDNGLVRLEVEPEVSKLDPANTVRIAGYSVPGLITRNTHTTVELKNGASLVIGGLYQNDSEYDVQQIPALGNIPVLGALFRSARWHRDETELVIIVTPKVAQPKDYDTAAAVHTFQGQEPSTADLFLRGKVLDHPITPVPDR
jgi:pilus assembly protein CpaC